jgi:spore photoproduct lyase
LGTGELSDSLALESIYPISQFLVPFFAEKNAILELKTKSIGVERLLSLDHRGRTVVSWSLNPPQVIEEEERETASLEERIHAAKRCQDAGYPLGFHFDPMIDYEGWEKGYEGLIDSLFRQIDPKRVVWISMGGFRYPAQLKGVVEERFPQTRIFLGELFPGRDGKFRYLKGIRTEMYRKMVKWLKRVSPDLFVYLCMESREVWEEVFGWSPENSQHLNQMFDKRVRGFL